MRWRWRRRSDKPSGRGAAPRDGVYIYRAHGRTRSPTRQEPVRPGRNVRGYHWYEREGENGRKNARYPPTNDCATRLSFLTATPVGGATKRERLSGPFEGFACVYLSVHINGPVYHKNKLPQRAQLCGRPVYAAPRIGHAMAGCGRVRTPRPRPQLQKRRANSSSSSARQCGSSAHCTPPPRRSASLSLLVPVDTPAAPNCSPFTVHAPVGTCCHPSPP